MASVNKVILIGNIGRDPDVRYMPNGEAVANIALATTESWKDKSSGEKRELTEWHRVTFYGKLAEVVGQYLKKGSQIYTEGRLQTRKWTDKENIERYTTEIIADNMQMLGARQGGTQQQAAEPEQPSARQAAAKNAGRGGRGNKAKPAPANSTPPDDDEPPF